MEDSLFTCLANPEAVMTRLTYAAQFFSWIFLMDDALEEVAVEKPNNDVVRGVSGEAIWTIIDGRQPAARMSSKTMMAFKSVWDEIVGGMPVSLRQRFVRNMKEHLRAQVESTSDMSECEHATIPSVASFILSRRMTSAAFLEFNLAEYSLGLDIEERVLRSESKVALQSAAADHIAWVNDLFSFRKEYLRGEFHNLPSVICMNSDCTFQEAVNTVCSMIEDREADYLRLVQDEMKQQPDPAVTAYLRALGSWMSANLHWSYQTARYHGVGNALVPLRSGVIQLQNSDGLSVADSESD